MGKDREPFSNRPRLFETLSEIPEVSVEPPQPAPSALEALSSSIHDLMSERKELRETIIALQERLAASEELNIELRKELARRDARSSRKEDNLGV